MSGQDLCSWEETKVKREILWVDIWEEREWTEPQTGHPTLEILCIGNQLLRKPLGGGWGFPGGLVVKHPSANAGERNSILDPGRSHMLQSN